LFPLIIIALLGGCKKEETTNTSTSSSPPSEASGPSDLPPNPSVSLSSSDSSDPFDDLVKRVKEIKALDVKEGVEPASVEEVQRDMSLAREIVRMFLLHETRGNFDEIFEDLEKELKLMTPWQRGVFRIYFGMSNDKAEGELKFPEASTFRSKVENYVPPARKEKSLEVKASTATISSSTSSQASIGKPPITFDPRETNLWSSFEKQLFQEAKRGSHTTFMDCFESQKPVHSNKSNLKSLREVMRKSEKQVHGVDARFITAMKYAESHYLGFSNGQKGRLEKMMTFANQHPQNMLILMELFSTAYTLSNLNGH